MTVVTPLAPSKLNVFLNVQRPVLDNAVLRWLAIAVLCAVYMSVSSGLVLLNKYLMSVDGFDHPLALSSLGMAFSSVASFVLCKVFHVVESKRSVTVRFYLTRMMPVGFFMMLTLYCGNLVYLYLTVSFISMLKAFCPIITMLALFIARLEQPSSRLITSVVLIAGGTALASYGETNLSYIGLFIMFSSETFESIRLVMTQVLLTGLNFHPIEGLMYLAPSCVLWSAIGVYFIEWPGMVQHGALAKMAAKPWLYAAAAAMGFGVNWLAYVVIQMASSLTLKVLGTVKNTLVVWFGILFFGEMVTGLQAVAYTISLIGFFKYNQVQMALIKVRTEAARAREDALAVSPTGALAEVTLEKIDKLDRKL